MTSVSCVTTSVFRTSRQRVHCVIVNRPYSHTTLKRSFRLCWPLVIRCPFRRVSLHCRSRLLRLNNARDSFLNVLSALLKMRLQPLRSYQESPRQITCTFPVMGTLHLRSHCMPASNGS